MKTKAFTLIELLVVIAIIAILAGILFPVLALARTRGRIAKAQSELYQIGLAIQMYYDDYKAYPPARTYCAGTMEKIDDYNELPPELYKCGYIPLSKFYDPFNRGRAYKYIAPGRGYSNGVLTVLPIWVPEDYPANDKPSIPYYNTDDSPIKWAVWSIGPNGVKDLFASEERRLPVPKSEWYPHKQDGVIVRLSDGKISP